MGAQTALQRVESKEEIRQTRVEILGGEELRSHQEQLVAVQQPVAVRQPATKPFPSQTRRNDPYDLD